MEAQEKSRAKEIDMRMTLINAIDKTRFIMARTSIAQTSLTSSQIDGKLPPQAKEIEQIILGACLIESDAFEKIASELSEADFYDKRNQSVFKAISGLYKERKPIDMMTVTQAMLSSGELESIGGRST